MAVGSPFGAARVGSPEPFVADGDRDDDVKNPPDCEPMIGEAVEGRLLTDPRRFDSATVEGPGERPSPVPIEGEDGTTPIEP